MKVNKGKLEEVRVLIKTDAAYSEFRDNEKVKDRVHLLTLSGSHAYGTARPESDIDIRGVVGLEKKYATGAVEDWQTKVFSETDTVIHSYKKMMSLLAKGNPDTVVLVGIDPDMYLYLSDPGRELVEKHSDFLGATGLYNSFIGYANAQLRRLELAEMGRLEGNNKLVKEKKERILSDATFNFHTKYTTITNDNLNVSFVVPEDINEKVIINSMTCSNINIDDYFDVARDLKNIVSSFGTRGKREKKTDLKLNKHCMHTVRGMLMGIETLETGKVITCREKDLPLLKSVLAGDYMDKEGRMRPEFYELIEKLRKKADYAYKNTVLPLTPDMNKVSDMLVEFIKADLN